MIEMCRTAFLSMHDVSVKRVRNAVDKATSTGTVLPDQRGKNRSGNATPEDKVELVRDNIRSLHTVSSHYSRAKSKDKKYLSPGLNMNILYNMYYSISSCTSQGKGAGRG